MPNMEQLHLHLCQMHANCLITYKLPFVVGVVFLSSTQSTSACTIYNLTHSDLLHILLALFMCLSFHFHYSINLYYYAVSSYHLFCVKFRNDAKPYFAFHFQVFFFLVHVKINRDFSQKEIKASNQQSTNVSRDQILFGFSIMRNAKQNETTKLNCRSVEAMALKFCFRFSTFARILVGIQITTMSSLFHHHYHAYTD